MTIDAERRSAIVELKSLVEDDEDRLHIMFQAAM